MSQAPEQAVTDGRKLEAELLKLAVDQEKARLEIRDLQRPLWQRNLPAIVAVVGALIGVFGSVMVAVYNAGRSSYEATQRGLADRFSTGLDTKAFTKRVGAAHLLAALDPPYNLVALQNSYTMALPTPLFSEGKVYLRVGVMEAVSREEVNWPLDRNSKVSILIRGVEDGSPLVRRKAIYGLWSIGEKQEAADALAKLAKDAKRESFAPQEAGMILSTGFGVVGSDDFAESPERPLKVPPFFIDLDIVTNVEWNRAMADANGETAPPHWEAEHFPGAAEMGKRRKDPAYADLPLIGASFQQAKDYCKKQGKALPTAAQWEIAAREPAGSTYPWGEATAEAERMLRAELEVRERIGRGAATRDALHNLTAASPQDVNPFGLRRLVGSVRQWVDSEHSAIDNPCQRICVVKGASAFEEATQITSDRFRLSRHQHNPATGSDDNIGFRCAKAM
jgi:formylglycine-generating enzyme required for sulfatase activity